MSGLLTIMLAEGRGDAPGLAGGLLVIAGVIVFFAVLFGGAFLLRARRTRRGDDHVGRDHGEHPPRRAGRVGGSG